MIRVVARGVLVFCLMVGIIACSKQEKKEEGASKIEEKQEVMVEGEEKKLPEGHPAVSGNKESGVSSVEEPTRAAAGHPVGSEVKREVKVPNEVKTKWKSVNLKVRDMEKNSEELISVNIGKETSIKGGNFAVKVEAFLPDYTIYDTYISSKSNEPVNPPVLIELLQGGKSVAKGWVFTNLTAFNSYKHNRYEVVLPPVSSPSKK